MVEEKSRGRSRRPLRPRVNPELEPMFEVQLEASTGCISDLVDDHLCIGVGETIWRPSGEAKLRAEAAILHGGRGPNALAKKARREAHDQRLSATGRPSVGRRTSGRNVRLATVTSPASRLSMLSTRP